MPRSGLVAAGEHVEGCAPGVAMAQRWARTTVLQPPQEVYRLSDRAGHPSLAALLYCTLRGSESGHPTHVRCGDTQAKSTPP
jgi:hypothetical protein